MKTHHPAVLLLLGAVACTPVHPPPHETPDAAPDPSPDAPSSTRQPMLVTPAVPSSDLDLLFVIDDSPSMADKQRALEQAFPELAARLATAPGGLPNLHLGVVTSDMGTSAQDTAPGPAVGGCSGTGKGGVLQAASGALTSGNFIVDLRDGTKNFAGTLADAFSAIANVGDQGCGFEQHLAAMRAALSNNAANTGFLRDGASLAVIVLADEDDCSARSSTLFSTDTTTLGPLQSYRCTRYGVTCDPDDWDSVGARTACHPRADSPYVEDVAPFRDFLAGVKGDPRRVMFGALVGDPTPVAVEMRAPQPGAPPILALAHSCNYTTSDGNLAVADPAVRLASLAQSFPGPARVESVCQADLTPQVDGLAATLLHLVGDTCLTGVPRQPLDCVVTDARDSAPGQETPLPACGAGVSGDCYQLETDPTCYDAPHLRLHVTRTTPPAADTWTTVRCLP